MQRISVLNNLNFWELKFREKVVSSQLAFDPSHDLTHFDRVVTIAKKLAFTEGACIEIVVPAAWLHDLVNLPKDNPQRKNASSLSAEAAIDFLKFIHYPDCFLDGIDHAIRAHSFSSQIEPQTLEAKVVQDADRLDAIGAIGIARCFNVGGQLRRSIYNSNDPFAVERPPDDSIYTLDHFFIKLFSIAQNLRTPSGQKEGELRLEFMVRYLEQLKNEILK